MNLRTLGSGAICISLCACVAHSATQTYHGRYEYNFEDAVFTPSGSNEQWCTVGNMMKAEVPLTYGSAEMGKTDVIVRGTVGPKGRFGNLGVCTREIKIIDVVKAHPYSPR